MKKVYKKPEIMFEDFSLSTNIAGDCEVLDVVASTGVAGCGYLLSGNVVVFTETACVAGDSDDFTYVPYGYNDGEYNSICYHIPDGGPNIFNS